MCGLHQRREVFLQQTLRKWIGTHFLWTPVLHNKPSLLISAKIKEAIFLSRANTAALQFRPEAYFIPPVVANIIAGGDDVIVQWSGLPMPKK